jgi:hypothetical protein
LLIAVVGVVDDNGTCSVPAGDGPDEGDNPADECPAEEEIENEDTSCAVTPADYRDDRGQEIGNEEHGSESPGEGKGEYPKMEEE